MDKKSIAMYILAGLVTIGFFFTLYLIVFNPPEQNELVYLIVGALIGHFATVINYFFGSSKSSQDKTDLLTKGTGDGPDDPPPDP